MITLLSCLKQFKSCLKVLVIIVKLRSFCEMAVELATAFGWEEALVALLETAVA